jgi:N-acetyl-1-D-myo-inositol-2-amino-2-deoxy-alpha-D-glucopyranoside deacetylase
MMGLPANENPRAFWRADLDEAAGRLVEIIREVRPQVVVTYDPNGFYGHPDHIQAHRVTMRAVELSAGTPWEVQKVYWTAVPRSALAAGIEQFAGAAENPFGGVADVADLPFGTADDEIAAEIEGTAYAAQKLDAMRAHATQIAEDDWLFTLARLGGDGALGREHYVLAVGERGTADGWEDDLFAGTT